MGIACLEQRQIRRQLVCIFSLDLGGVCEELRLLTYVHISCSWRRGQVRVLRVSIEHTAFLQASVHYRLTLKNWRECFFAAFCLCSMSNVPSVRHAMRLTHCMLSSPNCFLVEKLYWSGMMSPVFIVLGRHCGAERGVWVNFRLTNRKIF